VKKVLPKCKHEIFMPCHKDPRLGICERPCTHLILHGGSYLSQQSTWTSCPHRPVTFTSSWQFCSVLHGCVHLPWQRWPHDMLNVQGLSHMPSLGSLWHGINISCLRLILGYGRKLLMMLLKESF
jgi:hypothetical protein